MARTLLANRKRVVMITGGSRGIGLAVAKEYAKQGDMVVISGRNDKTSLEEALTSLRKITAEVSGALVEG